MVRWSTSLFCSMKLFWVPSCLSSITSDRPKSPQKFTMRAIMVRSDPSFFLKSTRNACDLTWRCRISTILVLGTFLVLVNWVGVLYELYLTRSNEILWVPSSVRANTYSLKEPWFPILSTTKYSVLGHNVARLQFLDVNHLRHMAVRLVRRHHGFCRAFRHDGV